MEVTRISNKNTIANIAVKDLERSKYFYEDTLGLEEVGQEGDEVVIYKSGHSQLFVYRSQYAGTNKATCVTWPVPDVESTVKNLKANGVKFEHYNMPGLTLKGDRACRWQHESRLVQRRRRQYFERSKLLIQVNKGARFLSVN